MSSTTAGPLSAANPQARKNAPASRRWTTIQNGILCFALGAIFMNFTMRYAFEHPIRIGQMEFRYFSEQDVTRAFHKQYAENWWYRTFGGSHWMGVPTMQIPFDLWVFQELLYEVKPDILIETGTHKGGSALMYATLLDQLKKGHIHTVDIDDYGFKRPEHPRITYYRGSSIDPGIVGQMKAAIPVGGTAMVVLDSLHEKDHVLKELEIFAPLVNVGSYLVVQDTHLNGHPVMLEAGLRTGVEGPYEAVEVFLRNNPNFEADRSRERFGMTASPMGWLKRVR